MSSAASLSILGNDFPNVSAEQDHQRDAVYWAHATLDLADPLLSPGRWASGSACSMPGISVGCSAACPTIEVRPEAASETPPKKFATREPSFLTPSCRYFA
jgi:hypothetical protein